MKIAVLYDTWEGTEEYPGELAEEKQPKRRGKKKKRPRPKLDREEIFAALEKLGHEPSYLTLDGSDKGLQALVRSDADLYFNLTESYAGDDGKEMNVAALLDLLEKKYTGSGPDALFLAQDKALAKKVFRFEDISTPNFAVSYKGRLDHAHEIAFPLIIKPLTEDGSKGIDANAVVTTVKELMERIDYIHSEFDVPVLIEEFIEGREIYGAVIGNGKPEALPLVELDLSALPDDVPKIAGFDVKYDRESEAFRKTKSAIAENLDEATIAKAQEAAVRAYEALRLRDYGRVDMRLTPDGRIYVIEANPNPWLASSAEFSIAARKSGRTYTAMIDEIVQGAIARYR